MKEEPATTRVRKNVRHLMLWSPPAKGDKRKRPSTKTILGIGAGKTRAAIYEKWHAHKPKECIGAAASPGAKREVETDAHLEAFACTLYVVLYNDLLGQ